jgi:hypothetical protein
MALPLLSRRALRGALAIGFAAAAFLSPVTGDVVSVASAAQAAPPTEVTAELSVVLASQLDSGATIDESLKGLPLEKEPFRKFNSYKLLDRKFFALKKDHVVTHALANGRSIRLTFLEASAEGRYKVRAEVGRGEGHTHKIEFTAGKNESVYLAGQAHHGGRLFLAITLRDTPAVAPKH